MKRERKIFTVKLTEKEMFAVTDLVNVAIEKDKAADRNGYLPLLADERNAYHGVIRKCEAAINEHHAMRSR
jgi:hypothetical protein